MFNYNNMIKRAIEFFPLWTDIRKRHKKSIGGKFLSSVIEESIKVEDTIQEYIDSYFLYNYIGHEDEVMAYAYMATLGQIDPNEVEVYYDNKLFNFAQSIKEFEEDPDRVFYENGYIYLKEEHYKTNINTITIVFDNLESVYDIVRVPIWNIFDEFATFVNTRRFENETNKQLFDRILYITKNLPNGTEDGLRHAIVSELMTDFPDLTIDDIKIERPTAENLIKPYEDYETLLDMLAEVNRDVYRTKRWDLDYWEYDFESISYIPHMWDKAIYEWQNGVGSFNDLEVIISDNNQTTDAEIYFYKKTLEGFQKYVYNKYIDNNIEFTLTRYNDILNKTNVKYRITASELEEITYDANENIKLKLYESKKQRKNVPIEDLAVGWGRDIERIDNSTITDLFQYRLEFESETGYDLIISKANVVYVHEETGEPLEVINLMEPKDGFVMNSEYELVSEATKQAITVVEHFTYSEGLENDFNEGITLKPGENQGTGVISLTDKGNMFVNFDYECETVDIPQSLISHYGCYWNANNEYVVRGDYSTENKTTTFTIEANYVSFNITDDSINSRILLEVIDDGISTEYDLSDKNFFETRTTLRPRNITFVIRVLSLHDVKFNNFKYNNFLLELNTKHGELEEYIEGKGCKLPNFYNNELTVDFFMRSGKNIILKGIYIGEDFNNIKYLTNPISARPNCIRRFEIVTNGKINLLQYNNNGILIKEVKGYDPVPSYKAMSDEAYLRLDLSKYDSIITLEPDIGSIEIIEESGGLFYNLKLKANQIAKRIFIFGTKIYEAREVTLEDMIKFYIPDYDITYDKIYCSKCSKGFVVGRQNPGGTPYNELVHIKSEIFTGLKIVKYVMELPSYLGTIYGSNNGYENRSNVSNSAFDYISIYPAQSQVYQAINEYDTYLSESKFINIVNNFTPMLNTSKLLFYKVENFDKNQKNQIVKFHSMINHEDSIEDMKDWTIGTESSYIAIQNKIDLLNNTTYDITSYNITDTFYLSSSVAIKDSYTVTNQTILNTERFMISTNNDQVSIKYDYYDGTNKKEHLVKHEEIFIESDGFNKLVYSNIDTIYHCSTSPFDGVEYKIDISYEILNEPGIIIWNDAELINKNTKVYLVYSIKKPIAFVFDLEYLYKAIDYDVEAYEEIGHHKLLNKKNGDYLNLLERKQTEADIRSDYSNSDLVKVFCTEPTFEARLKDHVLTFNKYIEEDVILIKTGYYYINGREYYLYSEKDGEEIKNNSYYTSENIDISGGEITTYKETNNYVSNTEMRLRGMSDLYSFDCSDNLVYGISSLNYLTACDSFNEWNTFETRLKLVDGLNGLALQFIPSMLSSYAFLDITDSLKDNMINYISFYATEDLQTYIAKEEKYLNVNFSRALNIQIDKEVLYDNTDIRFTTIEKRKDERYYLVVRNSGILDDIVVSVNPNSVYESHTKNISLLGFDLYEKKPEGSRYRMLLKNHKDYKSYNASLMSDGSIKTTSNLDWYITELKSYTQDEDFKACKLGNVGVNKTCIFTGDNPGFIETMPIELGNLDNIKRVIIKINDIELNHMINFSTTVSVSDSINGDYILCSGIQYENKFHIPKEYLGKYMKINIKMPAYKYINNIKVFVEYTSSDENPMPIMTTQTGYIESRIYDLQQECTCVVKNIDIEDISNINDVDIFIRASKDNERLDVWSDWRKIGINDDLKITNNVNFINTRFLQYKILIKNRLGYIKFKSIDVEIK